MWWLKIDKDAENYVKACKGCTLATSPYRPNHMKRRTLPMQAWIDIVIYFLGPLPSRHYLLVIVDYFNRYKEIMITKFINVTDTIDILKEIFSRVGIPVSITADNDRQITSEDFKKFCKECSIILYHSISYWPQRNGEVERQNRDILKRLKITQIQNSNWKQDLYK